MLSWPEEFLSCSPVKTHETKWNFKLSSHLLNHALCPLCLNWCVPSSPAKSRPAWGQTAVFLGTNFKVNKVLRSSSPTAAVTGPTTKPTTALNCNLCKVETNRIVKCHVYLWCYTESKIINSIMIIEGVLSKTLQCSPLQIQHSKYRAKAKVKRLSNLYPSKIYAREDNASVCLNLSSLISLLILRKSWSCTGVLTATRERRRKERQMQRI